MNSTAKIIIVGGGNSIFKFPKNIWEKLSANFTIACNHSFKDFTPTALCCADGEFYQGKVDYDPTVKLWNKFNPLHREKLSKLPLIITLNTPQATENPLLNTVFVKSHSHVWNREKSLLKGFYCHALTGQLALSLACYLLDFNGEIYLLGFDSNKTGTLHYYKYPQHRGSEWHEYYQHNDLNKLFLPYTKEENLKIYNVSMESEIEIFKKITPEICLQEIEGNNYNQDELRSMIKSKLK